jgi:hypothetical protein
MRAEPVPTLLHDLLLLFVGCLIVDGFCRLPPGLVEPEKHLLNAVWCRWHFRGCGRGGGCQQALLEQV